MHLIMFDIDGTLTQTMSIDEKCFVRALAEVSGLHGVDTDWSNYKHTTDSGIVQEIYETRLGRSPSPAEISKLRQHFVELLARASSEAPFKAVAGAPQLLKRLAGSTEHRVSIATGGWRDSARLKMASAGLCYDDFPTASGDDAMDRESIMRISLRRAVERYGTMESVIYVGDGVWDARACRNIGLPFIGIATGARAARLTAEGAVRVFSDFNDADLFLDCLQDFQTSNP